MKGESFKKEIYIAKTDITIITKPRLMSQRIRIFLKDKLKENKKAKTYGKIKINRIYKSN